jgi:oxygen-independent coproporphyrinogen-3 oxidase
MAGIYLHIPFCKKACHYCNFHFSTNFNNKPAMVKAIATEISSKKFPETAEIINETIDTIYFGGGTPSLLSNEELNFLLETIHKNYPVSANAEITLEANPDDITASFLTDWKNAGINRLSIGVQSFRDQDLHWMNRAHSANQSLESLKTAQDIGFNNISIDLIYGLPDFPNEAWQQNVEQALALNIPHLSCYALTVEPKTVLENFIHSGKSKPVDPELQSAQFLLLMDWLKAAGFEHYEISNFAKPGFRSRHNSSYWQGKPYFGFGPSAHSFDGKKTRWWNVANNAVYLRHERLAMSNEPLASSNEAKSPQLKAKSYELLTPEQQLNEYIMISLRTMEGIGLDELKAKSITNASFRAILKKVEAWKKSGKIIVSDTSVQLTNEGKLFADGIAADLFV